MNNKKIRLTVEIMLILIGIFFAIFKFGIYGKKVVVISSIIVIIAELVLFYIAKKAKEKNIGLHKIYLIFAIIFGSLFIIAFPASEIPDEICDYLRASEISELRLTTKQSGKKVGDYYSKNVQKVIDIDNYEDESKRLNLKSKGNKIFIAYANKSLYNFVCYIPQSIGIGIGKLLDLSIVLQIILGKIFNYIVFVLLMYLSIKYIPYKKSLVLFIGLLPITLQEATSLAPDALAISLSAFLVAYVLKLRVDNKPIENKNMVILFITTTVLSLCKIVYLPLCLLPLLIPKKLYKSSKAYYIYNGILIGTAAILNLLWLKYTSKYLIAFPQSSSSEQLKYILSNPLTYLITVISTCETYLVNWILQIVGRELGIFRIQTSIFIVIPALYILVKLIVGDNTKKDYEFNNINKIFIVAIVLLITALTFTSLYIQWTPLKLNNIEGVQGRYFIPLIIPLACVFMKKIKKVRINEYLIIFIIFQNIIALLFIIKEFI